MFLPILFIAIGLAILLNTMGLLNATFWGLFWALFFLIIGLIFLSLSFKAALADDGVSAQASVDRAIALIGDIGRWHQVLDGRRIAGGRRGSDGELSNLSVALTGRRPRIFGGRQNGYA